MNLERAREFYSAYYEGALDDGLRQAFQRALAKDPKVADEYAQFVRIMGDLKQIRTDVSVPSDLHARIQGRILEDEQATANKESSTMRLMALRPFVYGAAATVAIIAAVVSLTGRSSGNKATADLLPVTDVSPTIVAKEDAVYLSFGTTGKNRVTVSDPSASKTVAQFELDNQRIESPLRNIGPVARAVRVSFSKDFAPLTVFVPGKSQSLEKTGTGGLESFLIAVCQQYGNPVVVAVSDPGTQLTWTLDGVDPIEASSEELAAWGLKAELRKDGILWITAS